MDFAGKQHRHLPKGRVFSASSFRNEALLNRLAIAFAASLLCVATFASAFADNYSKFGFSSDDLLSYKHVGASIPSCSEAQQLDNYDWHHVTASPHLAGLYGKCHFALKEQHARIELIRVNDLMLGMQCIAIGGSGGDLPDACNIPSAIPAGK